MNENLGRKNQRVLLKPDLGLLGETEVNLGLGGVCSMCVIFFYLEHMKLIGVIQCISPPPKKKAQRTSKTAHRRAKQTKIWTTGGVWRLHVGIFLTLNMSRSFEVIQCRHHNQITEASGPLV